MTCTERPGNERGHLPAAKIFVVVKALGDKLKDRLRLKSVRADTKIKNILAPPSEFHSVHIISRDT